jgi:hypothetical protein
MCHLPALEPTKKLCGAFSLSVHRCDFVNHWLRLTSRPITILLHNAHSLVHLEEPGIPHTKSFHDLDFFDLLVCPILWISQ